MAAGHEMRQQYRGHHDDSGMHGTIMPLSEGYVAGPSNSSMAAVAQLFARLSQEIEEQKPPNCIHFIVNFLCKHYPEHLHGFASIWNMDPDLERERHEVVNFFKSHKISTAVAAHFTNAGYDTLDTLTTLSADQLVDVEAFNNVKWLPGHKVRLQQIFAEIPARVRAYRQAHPNQTSHIVGREQQPLSPTYREAYREPYRAISPPRNIAPVRAAPTAALMDAVPAGPPGGPREYVVNVSQPVRVGGGAHPVAPQVGVPMPAAGREVMTMPGGGPVPGLAPPGPLLGAGRGMPHGMMAPGMRMH